MVDVIVAKTGSRKTQEKIIETWRMIEPHAYSMMEIITDSFGDLIQILVTSAVTNTPILIKAFTRDGLPGLINQFKLCVLDVLVKVIQKGFTRIQSRVSSVSAKALSLHKTKLLSLLNDSLPPAIDKVLALINFGL